MQQIVLVRSVFGAALAVAGLATVVRVADVAYAQTVSGAGSGASAGCEAVNRARMTLDAAAGGMAARSIPLERGEALTLSLTTRGEADIAVAGGDAGRKKLHSGRSTSVIFVAPDAASYEIDLSADNDASATLGVRCTSAAKAATERALLDRRKALIAERDPDRIRIDRPAGTVKPLEAAAAPNGEAAREVTASVSASELASAMKIGQPHEPGILDFWFEGRYLTYDTVDMNDRASDGQFSVMYFGSKYMLGPDIMLGYLAQFDQAGESAGGGRQVSASGWMAGPYMSVRFGPGIIFDGRAAWGTAQSVPSGIAIDTTSSDRSLLRGTLRGTRQVAGWNVSPSVGLSYVEDTPAAHAAAMTDTATPAGTGRLDVLPEMKRRFDLNSETYVEPRLAAGGFMAFDTLSELRPAGMGSVPDLHWKAEAGVAVGVKDSMNLEATGGVESGGQAAPDNWSGRLRLNVPLGK